MKNKQFEQEIKTILTDGTPDVLSKIKQDPRFRVPVRERVSIFDKFKQNRLSYAFSSIFVLVLVGFAILLTQTSPVNEVVASTVTIDINPSVELLLDEDDKIIEINPINDDGEALIPNQEHFKGMTIDTAIRNLIQNAINQGYIFDEGNAILINVESENNEKKIMVQEKLETAFQREAIRHNKLLEVRNMIAQMTENAKEQASQNRMSNAKYELIQTILETTDDYRFEDLETASIRTLFSILNEINGDETNFPHMGPPSSMPGTGNGH
jgi:hypothetical protein